MNERFILDPQSTVFPDQEDINTASPPPKLLKALLTEKKLAVGF